MPDIYLGIDTSNYTSSCAVYIPDENNVISKKQLLPVPEGQMGLRQSDAVFHHTKNLPALLSSLINQLGENSSIKAVGASCRPRDVDGSYMPCFCVGEGFCKALAASYNAEEYYFSHQAGHIAAALWSSKKFDCIGKNFIAFHVSGGTTDVLLVEPDRENIFKITEIASSLDLKAGQAVDRVGGMLSLKFPAGPELDKLARSSDVDFKIKPYIKDGCCSFSGLQNKCGDMLKRGCPKEDIAKFCIDYIYESIAAMTVYALKKYGDLPLIFAGGVMSNSIIRERIEKKFGGYFAQSEFSSDNAAGIAYLSFLKNTVLD
ncbi:MAG: peptidase M22 [Clostridiales bacterium]|nr:peptidase M22 [Clostridiales bacterium]